MKPLRPRFAVLCLSVVLVFHCLCATGCDKVMSPGATTYKISSQKNASGEDEWTYMLETVAVDNAKGNTFSLVFAVTAVADDQWKKGPLSGSLQIAVVAPQCPGFEETSMLLIPEGRTRVSLGDIEPDNLTITTDKGPQSGPGFVTGAAASIIRSVTASDYIDVIIGDIKFRLSGDEVRGLSELIRRVQASLPK